jgi:hypothetical protein
MAIAEAQLDDIRHALAMLAAIASRRAFTADERARWESLQAAEAIIVDDLH